MNSDVYPEFVVASEALTDMIRVAPGVWESKNGGAGWNVARVLSWLGVSSAFAGAVSEDCFGQALWDASKDAALDMRFLQRRPAPPLLAIVHETKPVSYFFIGNDSADLHFDPAALPEGWMDHVRWACFGGISLTRPPLAGRLLELAGQLKSKGVHIAYDPNFRVTMDKDYDAILRSMAALSDVIKVSDEDLAGLFRTSDQSLALSMLRSMNPGAVVLYTCGAAGATLFAGSASWKARPPDIRVVDTVGAGDASMGGLLASLIRHPGYGWEKHLRAAVATGSSACLVAGAGLPEPTVIAELSAAVVME